MKKYEFVNVAYEAKAAVMAVTTAHQEIIREYAGKGYRYAGMIPTEMSANGCIRKMDLIFEMEE